MIKLGANHFVLLMVFVFLTAPLQVFAAGVVLSDATQLEDSGSASSPALWWLDQNIVTDPDSGRFVIGGSAKSYNQFTVDATYSFTASNGLLVGANNSYGNLLNIQAGGNVAVSGILKVGEGSISYYSRYNKIKVSGTAAALTVNGDLDMSNGYNATDNVLELSGGGIAVVNGAFSLYNHGVYGNSWLELDGGSLFLSGDKTADFAAGQGILNSIKVWDELSGEFQRVGATEYLDLLAVDYIQDSTQAASLGLADDYIGFTVVHNVSSVPIPGAIWLFAFGLIGLVGLRRKNN